MGWEFTIEPYPSGWVGFIDNPDRQFGNGSVWTRTWTRSDSTEPLLTLVEGLCILDLVLDQESTKYTDIDNHSCVLTLKMTGQAAQHDAERRMLSHRWLTHVGLNA